MRSETSALEAKDTFFWINYTNFKVAIFGVVRRFPLVVVLLLVLSLLLLIQLNVVDLSQYTRSLINRWVFSIVITFFLGVWIYLKWESLGFSDFKKIVADFWVIVFWILFFMWFKHNIDNIDNFIFFALTLAWIIAFLFVAPFLKKIIKGELNEKVYYSYFYNISVIFLISFILWWVLFLLWVIWIKAYFTLFDIKWFASSKIYWDWAILALSLITPFFALTQIPGKESFDKNKFVENVFFSFLVKYISIPFISVYFIILYSYTIRVLLNFKTWPKWEVTWLVIWFSIFGYLIYIFSLIFEDKNKFIKIFRSYFPIVVIPQLFMLFYAIYLRIAQYDITINRYFVVVFWIWLSVISLYFVFSKKKNIAYIALILTIFTIIISVWPWWVYSLPLTRQLSRLENNLKTAWILKNWAIFPLKNYNDITPELSKEIYSQISYLCNYDNCNSIKNLFPVQYKKIKENNTDDLFFKNNHERSLSSIDDELGKRQIVDWITQEIKVKSRYNIIDNKNLETLYFTNKNYNSMFPMDVSWYSKILNMNSSYPVPMQSDFAYVDMRDNHIVILKKDWGDSLNLNEIENKLLEIYKKTWSTKLDNSDMTFELKWRNWEIYKVFLENITIKNPDYKWTESNYPYYNASWYVLLR